MLVFHAPLFIMIAGSWPCPKGQWTDQTFEPFRVPLQATAKHSANFGTWQRCSWWQFLVENDCWWKGKFENNSFHHLMSTFVGISMDFLSKSPSILRYSKHSLGCSASSHQQFCKENPYVSAIRLCPRNQFDLGIFHLPGRGIWLKVVESSHFQ